MKIAGIILLSGLYFISGCAGSARPDVNGDLYFGGQGIYSFDLSTARVNEIYSAPGFLINTVRAMGGNRLLLSIYELNPSGDREKIAIFDYKKPVPDVILSGSGAIYMAAYHKVVYYNKKSYLSVFDTGGSGAAAVIIDRDPPAVPTPVIRISDDAFLFGSMRGGSAGIWMYEIPNGTYTNPAGLNNCSLVYSVWRARTGELFCREQENNGEITGTFSLVRPDGRNRQKVSLGEGEFWPLTYIGETDSVVLQERVFDPSLQAERHPVWLYSFVTESMHRIADDLFLGTGVTYLSQGKTAK